MNKDMLLLFFIILNLLFTIAYYNIFSKFNKLSKECSKLILDNAVITKMLDEALNDHKGDEGVHKENFIKFLSDSRDWAYEYIEDVQNSLNRFINEIEPEINYFKEYGDTMSMAPNYFSMKKIAEEYEKLKALLPDEADDK